MVEATEGEPGAQAHRELDDLAVGVLRLHPAPEPGVEALVVEGVPLGIPRGEPGALVEGARGAPVRHRLGEAVLDGDPSRTVRQSWQKRQPLTCAMWQPGGLELAQAERGVLVDAHRVAGRGDADVGTIPPQTCMRVDALRQVDDHAAR